MDKLPPEMIERPRVDQTVLGVGNPRANCFQACLAMLLERPIDQCFDITDPAHEERWHDALCEWGEAEGWVIQSTARVPREGYFIACGPTEKREGRHAIVCCEGFVFHDPHPSRDGITEAHYYVTAYRPEKPND